MTLTPAELSVLRKVETGASVDITHPDECDALERMGLIEWRGGEGMAGFFALTIAGAVALRENAKEDAR